MTRPLIAAIVGVASLGAAGSAVAATTPGGGADSLVFSGGRWAPVATALVHPGVVTVTKDAACTSNFLYVDGLGHTYLGQAAHCSGTGSANETDGCSSKSLPLGTPVQIAGTDIVGTLAYNSWLAMQSSHEKDANACAHNDLALIRLPDSAVAKANPSVPVFGGPVGLNTTGTHAGDTVVSYGNSPLRQGIALLSPKQGASLGDDAGGWSHSIYTLTPGIPGDSGSAVLDGQGRALGDLSTLEFAPLPGANQVSDLAHEIEWARAHDASLRQLRLVAGTQPFTG
ncbi:MAG TPA: serine protease [Sporichthyaceae bacterium]|nr:serine protease [Sporichthyaceae bacterium]